MFDRRTLYSLAVSCLILLFTPAVGVGETIDDYKPRTDDEAKLIKILMDYQQAINTYQFDNFVPLFSSDGMVQVGSGGKILHIQKYAEVRIPQVSAKFKAHACSYVFHSPQNIDVHQNTANIVINRIVSCGSRDGFATLNVTFGKENNVWKIKKMLQE